MSIEYHNRADQITKYGLASVIWTFTSRTLSVERSSSAAVYESLMTGSDDAIQSSRIIEGFTVPSMKKLVSGYFILNPHK